MLDWRPSLALAGANKGESEDDADSCALRIAPVETPSGSEQPKK